MSIKNSIKKDLIFFLKTETMEMLWSEGEKKEGRKPHRTERFVVVCEK